MFGRLAMGFANVLAGTRVPVGVSGQRVWMYSMRIGQARTSAGASTADLGSFLAPPQNSNDTFRVLNRQRELILPRPLRLPLSPAARLFSIVSVPTVSKTTPVGSHLARPTVRAQPAGGTA